MKDELLGKTFGSWLPLSIRTDNLRYNDANYNCNCLKCGITHIVSKINILSNTVCPTCPSEQKSPMSDVIDLLGGMLGLDANKRKEIDSAFEKLKQPEFKQVYASLERASASIKEVMSGKSGAPDVARKILEVEAASLKKAFSGLIEDGKISEDEVRILKAEVNSSANIQKLKSMLETVKQTRETKKTKI